MTKFITFRGDDATGRPSLGWVAGLAAILIAVAASAPVVACEKSPVASKAGAPADEQSAAIFTGEFIDGTPVYRLPAITVVSHRPAEVAKTRRNDAQHAPRSRTGSAPTHAGKVASASLDVDTLERCIG